MINKIMRFNKVTQILKIKGNSIIKANLRIVLHDLRKDTKQKSRTISFFIQEDFNLDAIRKKLFYRGCHGKRHRE